MNICKGLKKKKIHMRYKPPKVGFFHTIPRDMSTSTKLLRVILDAKYKKEYLNKIMIIQCQYLT